MSPQKNGIFCLAHSFLEIKDDLASIRYFASSELIVAVTPLGKVISLQLTDEYKGDSWESTTPTELVECIRSSLNRDISDARKLLGYGLMWLMSDVYGFVEIWEEMLNPDAEMFGNVGKANILAFKSNMLLGNSTDNYRIDAIHSIDVSSRVIVSDFECLIRGKEGRGTEVMKLDENWKLLRVDALRHGPVLEINNHTVKE